MLNMIVDTLEDVPEGAREHYEERDGKFQLDLKGGFSQIDRDKLHDSLRAERGLHTTAKEQVRAFGEHTPETISILEGERDQLSIELVALKKDGGPTGEDLDKLVEARVLSRLAPVERNLQRATKEVGTLTTEVGDLRSARSKDTVLRDVLGAFGAKDLGMNQDARPDVELWATSVFEVADGGKVVSRDGVGVTPGLSPAEIFKDMKDQGQRRHWYGATQGAGASGGSGSADHGENPFTLVDGKVESLTKASAMWAADPARAKRLCIAAKAQHLFPSIFKTE